MTLDGTLTHAYIGSMDWTTHFYYDETSPSCLRWKARPANCIHEGDPAGNEKTDEGRIYYQVKLNGKSYYTHRIVWEMFNGSIPTGMKVDHIKNISRIGVGDNRIQNLRLCSNMQNTQKKLLRLDSTSGFKGVNWNKESGKFQVRIGVNNKRIFIGYFTDAIEAAKAYDSAAIEYHGEYALTNKSMGLIK